MQAYGTLYCMAYAAEQRRSVRKAVLDSRTGRDRVHVHNG